jgi:hypothetical protein
MNKLLKISSILFLVLGIVLIIGGTWGITFVYKNVTQEKITTPSDSAIPNRLVSGPLTLKVQADIIRHHMLKTTNGKTYSEMPREIALVDAYGNTILNENGETTMVPNENRELWIVATSLITALNFGIIAYAFCGFVILFGLFSILIGVIFSKLIKK